MLKSLSKRAIGKLLSIVFDKPLAPPTNREKELIKELRATFCGLPRLETTNCSPSEEAWVNYMNCLRELVLNHDPREFLRWSIILQTMFVGYARYIITELNYLKSRPKWEDRWREAIKESPVGHPIPYWYYPHSSGNLIHHAYHLAQFEERTAIHVNNIDCTFEFGGGYGSMCRLLYNLGFRGKYVIFDLPAFSALQQFFLKATGITVHSVDTFRMAESGVICISDLEQLRITLSHHIEASNAMFIATWSISEAPIDLRGSILPLTSRFKTFLIAYQDRFEEVNNVDFFENWEDIQNDIEWHSWQIGHLPHNNYLVGKRKQSS